MAVDMETNKILEMYMNKNVTIFVRYGFKKRIEETQSYQGKFICFDDFGLILERDLPGSDDKVHDFFPWHNIDCVRIQQ